MNMLNMLLPMASQQLDKLDIEDIEKALTLMNLISFAILNGDRDTFDEAVTASNMSDSVKGILERVYQRVNG